MQEEADKKMGETIQSPLTTRVKLRDPKIDMFELLYTETESRFNLGLNAAKKY